MVGGGGDVGPAIRRVRPMAALREAAMTWARCRCGFGCVFVVGDVADVVLFSMFQWPRIQAASWAGPAGGEAGDGVDGFGGGLAGLVVGAAAFDLDGLGGVREGEAGRDGADLQAADLAAAVTAFVGAVVRDGPPGQGVDWRCRCRLVALTVTGSGRRVRRLVACRAGSAGRRR